MVSLEEVRQHNTGLKSVYGPNLVAIFVGGTSGIGEATARAFARNTISPHIYLVGRNEQQASKIIDELRQVNSDSQVDFIKCDVARLKGVDEACRAIQQKEEKVNLLFMTSGIFTTKGRDETDEGLDKKLSLHYYSRMRFIANLLPQLTNAGTAKTDEATLSRVVSVLEAGGEGPLVMDDLPLRTNYSLKNCAKHAITMTSLSMEELAQANPSTSFVHAYPGIVKTGLMRDFNAVTRAAMGALFSLASPWMVPLEESGERHLFAATSVQYPARGVGATSGVSPGSDGSPGAGAYLLNWDGVPRGNLQVLEKYRQDGVREQVWKHTLGVFKDVCGN